MSEEPPDKKPKPPSGDGKPSPRAAVRRARNWSSVWIVPLIAFGLAGWLVWEHSVGEGVLIHVRFETADGVEAEKTEVRCRSVKVGMVESAKLSKDLKFVNVSIRIDRNETHLLRPGTRFWVVRPRFKGTDISGLSTLFTGSYIEMDPGEKEGDVREFTGLEAPPVTNSNVPGLRLKLTSDSEGSISVGSPIYYKGYEVGHVELRTFDVKDELTKYDLFIEKDYASLVHEGSCFWNSSGIDISAGADGVQVHTPSLQAVLSGGITFGVPPDGTVGAEAHDGMVFHLYKDEAAAKGSVFKPERHLLLLFDQSVRGLVKGAPVEFRGIPLGRVEDISFKYAPEGQKNVPVLIAIDPSILRDAAQDQEGETKFLATAVRHGLRAKLSTGSLITGALFVDLDFVPDAPKAELWHYGTYDVLPTVSSGLTQLEAKVNAILDKVNALPIEDTMKKFGKTAEGITTMANEARDTLNELKQWIARDSTQKIPDDIHATLEKINDAVTSFGPNGAVQGDLRRSLDELRAALRSIKAFAENLEQKPNSLIFGNDKTGNPTPRAKKP